MSTSQVSTGCYFTAAEVAARLRVCTKTLERWRESGYGPCFLQLGRRPLYSEASLREWEAARTMIARAKPAQIREDVAA
jgi:Helix-turn-helix domain